MCVSVLCRSTESPGCNAVKESAGESSLLTGLPSTVIDQWRKIIVCVCERVSIMQPLTGVSVWFSCVTVLWLSLSVSHSRSRTETRQCSLLTARRYKTSVSRVAELTWCQRTEKLSKIRLTLSSSLTVLCGQPVHEKVKLTPMVHIMTGVTFR